MAFVCPACGNARTDPNDVPDADRRTNRDSSECYHERFGIAVPSVEVAEDKVPEGIAFLPEEWPHGLACTSCHRQLREGNRYSDRLLSLTNDGTPVCEVVCVECAKQSV